MEADQDDNLLT